MSPNEFAIRFAEHVPAEQIDSFIGQLAALGSLRRVAEGEYRLVVERAGKLQWLKQLLAKWEAYGWATGRPLTSG